MPKQILKIDQFHGGLNSNSDPRDIADNEFSAATDVMVDELGKIRTLGGTSAHDSSANVAAINAGYGLFQFSHDRTGGAGDGVATIDTLSMSYSDHTPGEYLNVALTGGTGNGVQATVVVAGNGRILVMPTITNAGVGGYVVNDTLTIPSSVVGGGGNETVDVATLEFGLETGDDYLAMADTDGAANIDIYSSALDAWGTAKIDLGSTTGMKPCFYVVDGALRVSDGNFGSSNENRWYGYIDRTLFSGSETYSIDEWVSQEQRITSPQASYFSEAISSAGISYPHNQTVSSINADSSYSADSVLISTLTAGNVCKFEVTLRAISDTYPLTMSFRVDVKAGDGDGSGYVGNTETVEQTGTAGPLGYSYHTATLYFTTTEIDISDATNGVRVTLENEVITSGSGSVEISSIKFYDGTTSGSGHTSLTDENAVIEFAFDTVTGADSWDDNDWEVGFNFVYDENQESLIILATRDGGASPDYLDDADSGEAPDIKLNIQYSTLWNKRISGANLYLRKAETASTTSERHWYHQIFYNFVDGVAIISGTGKEFNIGYDAGFDEHSVTVDREFLLQPNIVETFQIRNGYGGDEKSIISKYKTAVVTNRSAYIGGLQIQKEDGTVEVKGDTMIKSPVNKFDVFPLDRIIEVTVRDGDEIIKLEEYADRILQFKKKKMHLINVSQEIEFLEDTFLYKGVSHPSATCKTDFGIAWVNENGVYLYDGQRVSNLFEKGGMQMIKESEWTNFLTVDKDGTGGSLTPMIGYLPKKRQLIVYDDISNTSNGYPQMYLYDMVTQSWINGSSDATNRVIDIKKTNFVTDWNGDLVYAHTNGTVVKWDDASDATDGSQLNILTKDIDFGQPGIRKKIHRVHVTYRSTGDSGVRVQFGVDGSSSQAYNFSYSSPSTNFGSGTLDDSSGEWQVAELVPDTPSESTDKKSIRLQFWDNAAVPADFAINDISIVYRLKSLR
jgi:hypothetical protein